MFIQRPVYKNQLDIKGNKIEASHIRVPINRQDMAKIAS